MASRRACPGGDGPAGINPAARSFVARKRLMSTNTVTEPQHDHSTGDDRGRRPTVGEIAPSLMSEDDPTVARFIGLVAAVLVVICGVFLAWNFYYATDLNKYHFPAGWL